MICANVDVGKIGNQLSKFSSKLVDVRKLRCAVSVLPGLALMNLSNLINPAYVLCVYTCIRVDTNSCITLYVYVYTYINLSKMINTVCNRLAIHNISRGIVTFWPKAVKSLESENATDTQKIDPPKPCAKKRMKNPHI